MQKPSEALNHFSPLERPPVNIQIDREDRNYRYGFQVGSFGLLIDEDLDNEVVDGDFLYPLPATPSWFPGVINIRGKIAPVFDLKLFFDADKKNSSSKFLVTGKDSDVVAIPTDSIPKALEQLTLSTAHFSAPAPMNECIRNIYEQDKASWLELDFIKLFTCLGKILAEDKNF